jgi:oxygen-independent coproporphyrinogen-3 oxidase
MLEFLRDYYKDLYFSKRKDEMEEFMFLGLRMMQGISKNEFKNRFGVTVESVYGGVIEKYKQRQLLIEEEDRLYLSDTGIDVSNVVMAEFML